MRRFKTLLLVAQVILCSNHLDSQDHTDTVVVHELIHAFDDCRAEVNWSNCMHHACTEIRAARLSGDCTMLREFQRANFGVKAQGSVSYQSNCECTCYH